MKKYPLLTVILRVYNLLSGINSNLRGLNSASHAYETLIQVSWGGIMAGQV